MCHSVSPWPIICHIAGSSPWSGHHVNSLPALTFWCMHSKSGGGQVKWQFGKADGLLQILVWKAGLCLCRIWPFPSCLSHQGACPALEGSPAENRFLSCSLINRFTPGRVLAWPAITVSVLTLLASKMLLSPEKVPSLRHIRGSPVGVMFRPA